jgi:hypothetical protein
MAHGYLDKFSILGRCLILEGWASNFDLSLTYKGEPVHLSVNSIDRPDLVSVFGEGSQNWGFVACAALASLHVDRTAFRLRFNSEIEIDAPQSHFSAPGDQIFEQMIGKFQDRILEKEGSSLLEIGSRDRSGNSYRAWFPTISEYVGIDVAEGPGVDIVGDAHHLSRHIDRKFDFMFSMAVFEHLLMPWKVAIEMNRVLNVGGCALIISHNAWPLHEEPWDFWRYSKEAWGAIFNKHTGFKVLDAQYQHPASIVPFYAHTDNLQEMSRGPAYLLSGCYVEKTTNAEVWWDGEVSDVVNVNYSYE